MRPIVAACQQQDMLRFGHIIDSMMVDSYNYSISNWLESGGSQGVAAGRAGEALFAPFVDALFVEKMPAGSCAGISLGYS